MNEAIQQKIQFNETTAADLFDIFLNAEKHAAIHGGAETSITKNEGESFSLMNGNLTGRNLMIVPDRMIVQAWRGNVWKEEDPDSVLTLIFTDTDDGAEIEMIHAGTPDQFNEKWEEFYWSPIRKYISQ